MSAVTAAGAAMGIIGVHHVAIYTPNLARLRAFYVETLRLPVEGGFAEHNIVFIAAGGIAIELIEEAGAVPGGGGGWNHLAWEVADVDAAYAQLSARGVAFHLPPEDFPGDLPIVRIAFFKDPDGNILELAQWLTPAAPVTRAVGPSR